MLTTTEINSTETTFTPTPMPAAIQERRSARRLRQNVAITLAPMGRSEPLGCSAEDISSGGLFVCVPHKANLALGQRVEVTLGDANAPVTGSTCFAGEVCYATVIRTERRVKNSQPMLGAGLRFDHPLFVDPAAAL